MDGHGVRQALPSVCQSCCQGRAPVRTRSRNISLFSALHRSALFATLCKRYNACRTRAGDAFATRRSVPPARREAACFLLLLSTRRWARRRTCLCAPAYTRLSRLTLMLSRATGRGTFVAAPRPLTALAQTPARTRLAATGALFRAALTANARLSQRRGGRRAAGGPMTAKAARLLCERVQ